MVDSSLDDIKYVLNPTFTKEQIAKLDTVAKVSDRPAVAVAIFV